MKSLFDKVDEFDSMQIEKELISLDPHSFEGLNSIWIISRSYS